MDSAPIELDGDEASIEYQSSQGGVVQKRGPLIYMYKPKSNDGITVHVLDDDRILVASERSGIVRSVPVDEAFVEETADSIGPPGYDTYAINFAGRRVGDNPSITVCRERK